MNKLKDIDQFYYFLGLLLLVLVILGVVVVRGIFGAIGTARELDASFLESQTPRLHKQQLKRANEIIQSPEATRLDLKE